MCVLLFFFEMPHRMLVKFTGQTFPEKRKYARRQ